MQQNDYLQHKYHRILPRRNWYDSEATGVAWGDLKEYMVEDIRGLMQTLWLLDQQEGRTFKIMAQQCENLLPAAARICWQAYQGTEITITFDGYRSWYDSLVNYATEEQLVQFLALLPENCPEYITEVVHIAERLGAVERWQESFTILQRVPAAAAEGQACFWRLTGICLYHLGQYEASEECFTQIAQWGELAGEIQSYQQWLREAEENG